MNISHALIKSYALNDRMNQVIIGHLDPSAWRARLPASPGRTVAAIFSHVHNMRRKWLRLSAPHLELPATLDRLNCSQEQAGVALAESAARCCEMLSDGSVKTFHRDGWAKPWPANEVAVAYMISHDAHHRGQVCMLAHQLGYPLPVKYASGIWAWERLR